MPVLPLLQQNVSVTGWAPHDLITFQTRCSTNYHGRPNAELCKIKDGIHPVNALQREGGLTHMVCRFCTVMSPNGQAL